MRAVSSQLILNLIYKCNAAIALYNNKNIIDGLTRKLSEVEREIDKIILNQDTDQEDTLKDLKVIQSNVAKIKNILEISW